MYFNRESIVAIFYCIYYTGRGRGSSQLQHVCVYFARASTVEGSCAFIFARVFIVTVFMRLIYAGGPQWKCSVCLRKFSQRITLEQHHLTHFESRPYLCDLCGFNTRDRASLLKHRMKRHVDAGQLLLFFIGVCSKNHPQTGLIGFYMFQQSSSGKVSGVLIFFANVPLRDIFNNQCLRPSHLWVSILARCISVFIAACCPFPFELTKMNVYRHNK